MRAGWVVLMCAAVGCAADMDEPAPYSADMYGPCEPIGVVEFVATPVAGSTCKVDLPVRWDTSSTECPHEAKAYRQRDNTCHTMAGRTCRKPLQLVGFETSGWQFDWYGNTGTLSLTVYTGGNSRPTCESDWTLTAR